jgi:hypothetical protein
MFWQLITLSTFGVGVFFLFFPDDVDKVLTYNASSVIEQEFYEKTYHYVGVLYLLVSAGANQMAATMLGGNLRRRRLALATSLILYAAAGSAGITVLFKYEQPFIKEIRYVLLGLFIAFTSAVALAILLNLCELASLMTISRSVECIEVLNVHPPGRKMPASRADILSARR